MLVFKICLIKIYLYICILKVFYIGLLFKKKMKKNNKNINSSQKLSLVRKPNIRWIIILFCLLLSGWTNASDFKNSNEKSEKISFQGEIIFLKDSLLVSNVIFVTQNTVLFSSHSLIVITKKTENKILKKYNSVTKKITKNKKEPKRNLAKKDYALYIDVFSVSFNIKSKSIDNIFVTTINNVKKNELKKNNTFIIKKLITFNNTAIKSEKTLTCLSHITKKKLLDHHH